MYKCTVGLVKVCDAISANVGFYLRFGVSLSQIVTKQEMHI